jgi:hypothetical protein
VCGGGPLALMRALHCLLRGAPLPRGGSRRAEGQARGHGRPKVGERFPRTLTRLLRGTPEDVGWLWPLTLIDGDAYSLVAVHRGVSEVRAAA